MPTVGIIEESVMARIVLECQDCYHQWVQHSDFKDRSCKECKSKNTEIVEDERDDYEYGGWE